MTDTLAERVEGLTGPCRETDVLVYGRCFLDPSAPLAEGMRKVENPPALVPHYTESVDAVVALIAVKVPGRSYGVEWRRQYCQAYVTSLEPLGFTSLFRARTPALALLAATLRAMEKTDDR